LEIETAFNPTMTQQSRQNWGDSGTQATISDEKTAQKTTQYSNFSTYGNDSAVHLTSIAGDVLISNNESILGNAGGNNSANTKNIDPAIFTSAYIPLYGLMPGTFTATAFGGNLSTEHGFTLAGSTHGQFELLAANSVDLKNSATQSQPIVMLDVAASQMSPYYAPRLLTMDAPDAGDAGVLDGKVVGLAAHASSGLHDGDTEPARIVALTGDISGDVTIPNTIILPKKAEIIAGRDIKNLGFSLQQQNPTDVTRVVAGRDLLDSTIDSDSYNPVSHLVSGGGRVDFVVGRNFDLGDSQGVVTVGNQYNPYLPAGGASINILAGSGNADYVNFARSYIAATDLSDAVQQTMKSYVLGLRPDLDTSLSVAAAWDAFKSLTDASQNKFFDSYKPAFNQIFFNKLVASSKIKGLSDFDQQIASLYPEINQNGGNINLFGSELETLQGGSINMFAPGGSVYAGLASPPAYFKKPAASQGIFTVKGGDISALVKTDFEVFEGRVFSLAGGDITLISQYGDISAGKGAKTASSAPPPLLTTDQYGNSKLDLSASISGSGIAALRTDPAQPPSNIYVIAPRGTLDAGDAGIRIIDTVCDPIENPLKCGGGIYVNASLVLNSQNIQGPTTGLSIPNLGLNSSNAPVSAATKTDDFTKNLNNLPATGAGMSGTLTVDVVSYGPDCNDPKGMDSSCSSGNDNLRKPN
ncbi:MAG: filamentous hemagglutinin family protein, partial [Burkholderiaceae bacterium]